MSTEPESPRVFTLRNRQGTEVTITNFGGIVMSLRVPDRDGRLADVVLGFDEAGDYLRPHPYFGALIGRYANRIAGGRFHLEGVDYALTTNDGPNQLHGGHRGFDKVVWTADSGETPEGPCLSLTHKSPDGDEGFPGELSARVTYTLTKDCELRIDHAAVTDRPTVVSLTHHSYFNLAGHAAGDVLGHELFIDADHFTPVGTDLIPTGAIASVAGTPLDFRHPTTLGSRIQNGTMGQGIDHNFVLNRPGRGLRLAARVSEPVSRRVMEVFTTEPGLQLYTGNGLDGSLVGKGGAAYRMHGGFCLETQAFPDSPNQPRFPSTRLAPGETYASRTIYRFSVAP